ncbi:MAG: hypothetical protein KAF91_24190 [Nostoc sp. TH1S01]|nr:hypothetical protein [Nostoc sp. TH1S01]
MKKAEGRRQEAEGFAIQCGFEAHTELQATEIKLRCTHKSGLSASVPPRN